jgi:hypothetical protein
MCIVASTLELSHCSHWFDGNTEQWWLKTQKPSNPIHSVLMYTKVQNLEVLFFSFPFPFLFLFFLFFFISSFPFILYEMMLEVFFFSYYKWDEIL